MLFKSVSELNFVGSEKPMPAVEIDLSSLNLISPEGYAGIVEDALRPLAAADSALCCSVWVYQGVSCNFMKPGYSAFFAVPGRKTVLKALYEAFEATPRLLSRHSDQIMQSESVCQFHIQEGQVWREFEPHRWCAGKPVNEGEGRGNEDEDEDEMHPFNAGGPSVPAWDVSAGCQDPDLCNDSRVNDHSSLPARRPQQKGRTQRARSDASLGSISRSIETLYGLPEGSVALRGPDKKVLRRDATVGTLRGRWE